MKWTPYQRELWHRQPLPRERRPVLVRIMPRVAGYSRPAIAVGYMKLGAGEADSPYFVVPSVSGDVIAWCDCLPDVTVMEMWRGSAEGGE